MKINKLTLKAKDIQHIQSFYRDVLGLALIEENASRVSFKAGASTLEFIAAGGISGGYHFAFNIPPHTINDFKDRFDGRLHWLSFEGKSIVDFKDWKAKSLYFFDAENNILEFIARDELETDLEQSIVSIGEVGVPVEHVYSEAARLKQKIDITNFERSAGSEHFMPLGDDDGLIILVRKGRSWFPTQYKAVNCAMAITVNTKSGDARINYL